MDKPFNFNNLSKIYNDAFRKNEKTIAFEIGNGKGIFLFMIFFDEGDTKSRDTLYLFLKRTRRMLSLKMWGSHRKGDFNIYFKKFHEAYIKEELGLENPSPTNPFSFEKFLNRLNNDIPLELALSKVIKNLNINWNLVKTDLPANIVEDHDKPFLKGFVSLPYGSKPRERTLRKLYIHMQADSVAVTELIEKLKRLNKTVAWTNDHRFKEKFKTVSINDV